MSGIAVAFYFEVITVIKDLEAIRRSFADDRSHSSLCADQGRFAPRDIPTPATIEGMVELFETHEIPSAFVAESLQHVSQSFSVQTDTDSTTVFFHLLVKDISMSAGQIVESLARGDTREAVDQSHHKSRSQANFNWLKPGFVLRVRNQRPSSPPLPIRATTSSSDITLTSPLGRPAVELFCFGAPANVGQRFQKIKDVLTRKEIELDPYILLEIVLAEMYESMDRTAWTVADIFGKIEEVSLSTCHCTPLDENRSDHMSANFREGGKVKQQEGGNA